MIDKKKISDKFYKQLRSGDDIHRETDLSFDELIDKYYNITDEKLHKNHICILRDVSNNDKAFNEIIEYYRNFSEDSKRIDFNTPCENCDLECCNNINVNFNFFAAVFITDLFNRRFTYNSDMNAELTNLFFKQFYIEENEIKFNEKRMMTLFIDYDIEVLEEGLTLNETLTNIKTLLEVKNYLISFKNRFNNLSDEKITEIKTHINFTNNKLEFYQNIYDLEKQEQLLLENNDKKVQDDNPNYLVKKTKSEIILAKLNKYGFSELEMLKNINIINLAIHIFNKKTFSYKVAYLYHLGLVKHLNENYCDSSIELNKILADILNTSSREIAGNINVLNCANSTEKKTRYDADEQLEKVIEHYQTIS